MIKNDKVTFLTIDLLEYIMYVTELPFWTQLCTKEFLMKISQILQSKEKTSQVEIGVFRLARGSCSSPKALTNFLNLIRISCQHSFSFTRA